MGEQNTYDHIDQISGISYPFHLSPAINIRASLFGGFNTVCESLSHSPQESIGSERWTPSPSETASPSRSSPSYGTSSYDFGVDVFLNNIRQPGNGLPRDIKSVPVNDTQNHQDRDCTNLNSEIAAKIPDTNSDNKVDEPLVTSSAVVPSSSQMVQYSNPSTPTQQESHYCGIHGHTSVLYCNSCNKTLCSICEIYQHHGHMIMDLIDASRLADIQSNQTLSDIKFRIAELQENLNAIQKTAQTLEYNASEVKKNVSLCIDQTKFALQKREQELYKRIDEIKNQKFEFLKFQDYNLKHTIKQLLLQADKITNAKNLSNVIGNPVNFFLTKEDASTQISKIENNCLSNIVVKDNWISFSATTDHVLSAIGNLGRVKLSSLGFIGDGRFLKGRGNLLQVMHQQNYNGQLLQIQYFNTIAPGRPVPSVNRPVIVNPQNYFSLPVVSVVIRNSKEEPNVFLRPWGVACDKDGNIIVSDRTLHCIKIFNQNGRLVRRFGTKGKDPGEFYRPTGVAVDEWRRIIVVDKDNHRVQIFTMEGEFILAFGKLGKEEGEFHYPWDVATNTDCQIVITDSRNYRVQLFSPDGVFLRKFSWAQPDRSKQSSYLPRGVAFNPQGEIVVTDMNKHYITVIRFDMLDARVITSDKGMKKFCRLQSIVIDDEGNMIVADSRNYRIVVLDPKGNFKYEFGSYGVDLHQLNRPTGITLTPKGQIVVVDFINNRVMVY